MENNNKKKKKKEKKNENNNSMEWDKEIPQPSGARFVKCLRFKTSLTFKCLIEHLFADFFPILDHWILIYEKTTDKNE